MCFEILGLVFSVLIAEIKVGDPAPTFFVRTIDNKNFFLSDTLKKSEPIVLSFFATWCLPCRKEIPVLDTLSNSMYINV